MNLKQVKGRWYQYLYASEFPQRSPKVKGSLQMKGQPTEWKKIVANYMTDKGLIYIKNIQLNIKKLNNPVK